MQPAMEQPEEAQLAMAHELDEPNTPPPAPLLTSASSSSEEVARLERLAESLLLRVAESEVALDQQAEEHAIALAERRKSESRLAWFQEAPSWLRASVAVSLFALVGLT